MGCQEKSRTDNKKELDKFDYATYTCLENNRQKEGYKLDKHDIHIPADLDAVIWTDQPDTISIDGVEIPSRSYLNWRFRLMSRRLARMKALCAVECVATAVLTVALLLR